MSNKNDSIWQRVADLEAAGDLAGAIALAKVAEQTTTYRVRTDAEIRAALGSKAAPRRRTGL